MHVFSLVRAKLLQLFLTGVADPTLDAMTVSSAQTQGYERELVEILLFGSGVARTTG